MLIFFNKYFQAVNGPLQQRTTILDADFSSATAFPDDYDTDIEFDWSDLSKILINHIVY
jgi:hypothetical protein